MSDDEFYFIHYYLQKGHDLRKLLNLTEDERLFMAASLLAEKEEQAKQWEKLSASYSP
nr:MAG TPA: hypothetical protein [Caudoviricetes sp.]